MKELHSVKTSQGYINIEIDFDSQTLKWLDDNKVFRNRQAAHQRRERLEKQMSLVFYSLPSDGPAICAVERDGHMYEVRSNGYGGYGLVTISDEEVKEMANNMLELGEEEIDVDVDKVREARVIL